MQFSNGTNGREPKICCKMARIEIASKIVQLYILLFLIISVNLMT